MKGESDGRSLKLISVPGFIFSVPLQCAF